MTDTIWSLWKSLWHGRENRFWLSLAHYPRALLRAWLRERLQEDAQALVYVTLLTLVPLLAVAFALLRGFGVEGIIEPWLRNLFTPMGAAGDQVVAHLLAFVNQTKAGGLGIIGVIFLFVSVMNLAQKLETTLNRIWRVTTNRALRARLSGYIGAVLLAPVLIGAIMSSVLGMQNAAWLQPYLHYPGIRVLFRSITGSLPVIMVFLAIAAVYAWTPNRPVRWRAAFAGSAFFLVMWYPISWLFGVFIAGSHNYSVIYSSFASIVILLFWLYFLWLSFLLGAKTASLVQLPHLLAPDAQKNWFAGEQLQLAAAMTTLIIERFSLGQTGYDRDALNDALPASPDKIQFVLVKLREAKLIAETADECSLYLPTRAASHYTFADLYRALACPDARYGRVVPALDAFDSAFARLLSTKLYQSEVGEAQEQSVAQTLKEATERGRNSNP